MTVVEGVELGALKLGNTHLCGLFRKETDEFHTVVAFDQHGSDVVLLGHRRRVFQEVFPVGFDNGGSGGVLQDGEW